MTHSQQRLIEFLSMNSLGFTAIEALTPDASLRHFFRVKTVNSSFIACVYPLDENGKLQFEAYLDTTNLFLRAELPVARIIKFNRENLIILHEDFGDIILRDKLQNSSPEEAEKLLNEAIRLIAKIQSATTLAYELDSIAAKLKFDNEKLLWELDFFKTHYFESLLKKPLSRTENLKLEEEFLKISKKLENKACVLVHRDFHTANLMYFKNQIKIIDHQDARIGSTSYDLVSLLLDRITTLPKQEWIEEKCKLFLSEREKLGLDELSLVSFLEEFKLQSIQRCLKAIGTFSYQAVHREKKHYLIYIRPMFDAVIQACTDLNEFPTLRQIIRKNIDRG